MIKHKSTWSWLRSLAVGYKVLLGVIIALIIFRLLLPGIVKHYVNTKLNALPGYTGHVVDIDISLYRGAYVIKGLLLKKTTDPAKFPFLAVERADLSVEWRALFKGRLVGEVILDRPAVHILATEDISKEPSKESWTQTVKALMPMMINRLQVNNGKLAYVDLSKKPVADLHIDHMQLTALNLANVQKEGKRLPSHVSLTGTSIGGGHLKADMDVNALKDIPDLDLGLSLTGTNLLSLNQFFEANAKMDVERGRIDIFSKFTLMDGEMNGYVKPFISDLKILNVKKDIKKKGGLLRVVKKAVVGLFAKAVTNPKTKKIATVIPIKGNIKDPKTSVWATFVGILKNAFVHAFHESLSNELKFRQQDNEKN
ncbi:DUF748 domain-containing protein [Mucilaginibacter jinjuensis]|uniref:DUF748 domain-containing protein n=1 Tax=Mucilaginibacter jinjuensis TaxID=1176721 RepID=A0ABY7TB06_9SPHI|nr:DUF748 domain-containing protein [Mucilaginibacter jinjuensis]WCT13414.1 DUF748 domain-containing protein [Mucilaginibacter jinjuensis]